MNLGGHVTSDQAADLLGIKLASVYLYVRRLKGFPQPVKVGRTLLFEREALLAWREAHPKRAAKGGESPTA
ncbi:helix-turn-helix domain-containing protein [Micromonospora sp. MED01]|uniref:helix-turn-helix domain-containing protein n=1 Tax=Micromonospora alfalfae TaxID=2911212 RepID=UPI001EE85351|nr:helix-turn-helix domain-containing protein [Micromonospora alfalfae]MCG5464277.1 helix-turn-helix domain-containing protein [Micromonospora alfalfae]